MAPLLTIAFVVLYLAAIRPQLMPTGSTAVVELAVVVLLVLALLIAGLVLIGTVFVAAAVGAVTRTRSRVMPWLARLRRQLIVVLTLVLILSITTLATQWLAYTPPILGVDGEPLAGSVATLEQVNLGGSEQWISVRGNDIHKPVLLYLAGGPGGSELAPTRVHLGELENHFIVVNWDQPGAGKSYDAVPLATLTPERYIADGHELTLMLRERFGQEKIFVFGDSWGSVLGILLVQRYPELFHAYIGTGQMVAFTENDRLCYDVALRLAHERQDNPKILELTRNGPPPYYGAGVVWKEAAFLLYLNSLMPGEGGDLMADSLLAPEYGVYDKVNVIRGAIYTLDAVYPHLWSIDLRKQALELQVPVYILHGSQEFNAMPALVEEYYQLLAAPHKELIWFEDSGHFIKYTEPAKLVEIIVNQVLSP